MVFPFGVAGRVPAAIYDFDRDPTDQVLERLEAALSSWHPARLHRGTAHVAFRTGLFGIIDRHSILMCIGSGRLEVHDDPPRLFVAYKLSFVEWLGATLALFGGLALLDRGLLSFALLGLCLGLFALGVLYATVRFRFFVRRVVQELV